MRSMDAVEKRAEIARLREQGLSYSQIEKRLGISRATIAYHSRRLGIPVDERAAKRYDWDEVQAAYDAGLSVRDCVVKFGFSHASWHEAVKRGAIKPRRQRTSLEDYLVEDRTDTWGSKNKRRALSPPEPDPLPDR